MLIKHAGRSPRIHESAWVAPGAIVSGDVEIGPESRVLFGAVITADGGPVRVGSQCVIMENAVLRGTRKHPLSIGNRLLVGLRAYLSGCTVNDETVLATGSTVFNGAVLGQRTEVQVNGTVHLKTVLPCLLSAHKCRYVRSGVGPSRCWRSLSIMVRSAWCPSVVPPMASIWSPRLNVRTSDTTASTGNVLMSMS